MFYIGTNLQLLDKCCKRKVKINFGNDINDYTNCHSERQRRIFIVKMLHFVQHDSEWMISEVQTDISLPNFLMMIKDDI